MALKTVDRLKKIEASINPKVLIDIAYPVFIKNTPVLTGNAKRHTTKTSSEINANYAYAQRLNEGYSSKSPNGMVQPAIDAIRSYIRKTLG
jgi:hypothetical protein